MKEPKFKTIKWDGKKIISPGMYGDMSIDLYHDSDICDGPSISSSGLRTIFSESPAHFYAEWRGNPEAERESEKRHFILGRAAHHLLLGQAQFSSLFVTQPIEYEGKLGETKPWNNNAEECRRWHQLQRKAGKTVLTAKEAEQIIGMAEELARHPIVQHGALNGLVERSLFWKDKTTGIWLKSRPDAIPGHSGDFVDYKSTTSVKWPDLCAAIYDFGYNQQGALICEAAREVLGIERPSFTLVFQEKKRPFCVRVVTLKDNDLDRGHKQNRWSIDKFVECLKADHWPGPGGDQRDAEYVELPEWAQKRIDGKLEVEK